MDGGTVRVTLLMWATRRPAGHAPRRRAHLADGRRALDGRGQPHPELDAGHHHAAAGGRLAHRRQPPDAHRPDARRAAPRHRQLRARPHRRAAGPARAAGGGAARRRRRRGARAGAAARSGAGNANLAVRSLRITGTSVNAPAIPQPLPDGALRLQLQPGARTTRGSPPRWQPSARRWAITDKTRLDKGGADRRAAHARRHDGYAGVHETGCTARQPAQGWRCCMRASSSKRRSTSSRPICPRRPRRVLERVRLEFA